MFHTHDSISKQFACGNSFKELISGLDCNQLDPLRESCLKLGVVKWSGQWLFSRPTRSKASVEASYNSHRSAMLSVCSPSEASLAKTIVSSTLHSFTRIVFETRSREVDWAMVVCTRNVEKGARGCVARPPCARRALRISNWRRDILATRLPNQSCGSLP
jgi:hypothetical protein